MNNLVSKHKSLLLIPIFSIVIFVLLYIYSTTLYPGGSHFDNTYSGYSWSHNYLCNLLGKNALNGQPNEAKIVAISSVMVLGFGIGYFYLIFPRYFELRLLWRRVLQVTGVASMCFAVLLFTDQHDLVLNIAGVLGGISISISILALARNNSYGLMWMGLACCFLLATNAYIYYTNVYIDSLPLIQKFTILGLILWIILMNLTFYRREPI